ncbi:IclR family transcriptional regulator [Pseudonocardia sp. HH130630-07]|uniref:IclR family transcriptional regulator n=1 Tax=Pseudonocardia sp. HH130630-07 TaxID=1690815 RepID=UPI000814FAF0|nr:IclR family transcriptional regulator [Pseudonocardia sp. HH130630-07]ANY09442.1 IclR family transcriptional regulator [Pseudonocardia sp. HH130630-07]
MELIRPAEGTLSGETPALRVISLLELIASQDRPVTLPGLVEATGLPKPTLHRMVQSLEAAGLLVRFGDGRQYTTGARLHGLAENLLFNASHGGGRRVVLRHLVTTVGESCNITTLSRDEVIYLDRVETSEPLRFYLRPGSRVPVHCSASGKLFLAQMAQAQRARLLESAPLRAYTPNTTTDVRALYAELDRVAEQGYAVDDEEFLPGLVCAAVLVPSEGNRSGLGVAVQAPAMRLSVERAHEVLPALREAAVALSELPAEPVTDGADEVGS